MRTQGLRFKGAVVIVTGAAGGLGRTLVLGFIREGASVYAVDRVAHPGEAWSSAVQDGEGQAVYVQGDVATLTGWQALVEQVRQREGRLDVLVNCAGIVDRQSIRSVAVDDWQRVLDINLTGPMLGIQSTAALMRASGGGAVVNIGSTAALIAHPGVAYCASKWGLRGVTASAALELLDWGIRVNSVHPAQIQGTGITTGSTPGWRYAQEKAIPMQRGATSEEVTQAVLFLASDAASYITGSEIAVDGGTVSTGMARARSVLQEEYDRMHGEGR